MSKDEMRELIQETVRQTLSEVGMDPSKPTEMQRDMAFLRDLRKARDSATAKAVVVAVGLLVTAGIGAMVLGFKQWLQGSP